jgi:hypothetical protein
MIRLDELERHARAYLPDENRRAHPAHVQAYYGHCGPDSMLALIKAVRAAQNAVNQGCLMHAAKGSIELIEALKEVEQ